MRYLTLIVWVFSWASSAWAGFDEGMAAYERKDYAQAFAEFRLAAVQGNVMAQFNLGLMYANGQGVAQDYSQAAAWYRKAAEQGDTMAQHNLGFMYKQGRGVAQDYRQAVAWYRKAAEQGEARAQTNLGEMFRNGQGVAQDYRQAVAWYRKAAEQGDATAQNNLGSMYRYAMSVPQSQVIAYALYNLSYSNDPSSNNKAGNNRKALADDMTAQALEAGQVLTTRLGQPGMFIKALDAAEKSLGKTTAAPTAQPVPKAQAPVASKPVPVANNGNCRPRTNQLSCSSQCYNGDCVVTYENGCKVRVQVSPKFDPFTSQWTYPAPSC